MELSTFFREYVLPEMVHLRTEIFAHLNPKQSSQGRPRITLDCPQCGHKGRAWIYDDRDQITCNRRNECGYSQHIVMFLNKGLWPAGEDYKKFVKYWADRTGQSLPRMQSFDPEVIKKKEIERQLCQSFEKLFADAQSYLTPDTEAFKYLRSRGFSHEGVTENLEFGLALNLDGCGKLLSNSDDPAEHRKAIAMWSGRILIPVRDRKKQLRGLVGRVVGNRVPKYINTVDCPVKEIGGIGWDVAAQHKDNVFVVEGPLDVYTIRDLGYPNSVAIGSTGTAAGIDRLNLFGRYGIRQVTFVLDNDEAGIRGAGETISASRFATDTPEPFVVDPRDLGTAKDISEYRLLNGDKACIALLERRIHGYRYAARLFASGVDLLSDAGRSNYALRCIAWDEGVSHARGSYWSRQFFLPEVEKLSETELEFLLRWREQHQNEEAEKNKVSVLAKAAHEADALLSKKEYIKACNSLRDGLEKAALVEARQEPHPCLPLSDYMEGLRESILSNLGSNVFGMTQKTIPLLDEAIQGFQGLNLISGKSGEGKTMAALQWALDILDNHPDTCCLIVSADMLAKRLQKRLLCNRAGLSYRELEHGTAEGGGHTEIERRSFNKGFVSLSDIAHRIQIVDRFSMPVAGRQEILRRMAGLKESSGCRRCLLVIDYLELLHLPPEIARLNQNQIDEFLIEEVRYIADGMQDEAIMCMTEAKKDDSSGTINDSFRGSVRKIHRADTTILLRPFNAEELVNTFIMSGDRAARRVPKPTSDELKNASKLAKELKAALSKQEQSPTYLCIGKARDGGHRAEIPVMHYFKKCTFRPII